MLPPSLSEGKPELTATKLQLEADEQIQPSVFKAAQAGKELNTNFPTRLSKFRSCERLSETGLAEAGNRLRQCFETERGGRVVEAFGPFAAPEK